jgi:hypothetical protein
LISILEPGFQLYRFAADALGKIKTTKGQGIGPSLAANG